MQRARAFFYVSLGILALGVAFHLGATSAHGQSTSSVAAGFYDPDSRLRWVIAQNGDAYVSQQSSGPLTFSFAGNVFSGAPVPTKIETWGRIKADRR
jgi:hypothetical protein